MPASVTRSQEETEHLAEALAVRLRAGDVLLLSGSLGAGKTAFVRGLAEGLGIDPGDVSSPTFTIVQEYRGPRLTLQHVDLYRLSPAEVSDLALDDLLDGATIMAIEWAERLPREPAPPSIRVTLAHQPAGRTITIDG